MLQDLMQYPSEDDKNQRAPLSSTACPRSRMPHLGREEAPPTADSMERQECWVLLSARACETSTGDRQGILPSDLHPCVGVHSLTLVHGNHSCADTRRRRASLATSSGLGTWSSVRVANRTQCSGERTAYRIVLFSVLVGLSDFSLLEVNEG